MMANMQLPDQPQMSAQTRQTIRDILPWFNNHFDYMGNPTLQQRVLVGLAKAIEQAEVEFKRPFGGWLPNSAQFGIQPLRPKMLGYSTNEFIWTSGASDTSAWAASDTIVNNLTLADDLLVYIYGIYNLEAKPNTKEIQVMPGNETWPIWNLDDMRVDGKNNIVLPETFYIKPSGLLSIKASCRNQSIQERFGFLGFALAKNSKMLNKTLA